jgi:hypothetical protein
VLLIAGHFEQILYFGWGLIPLGYLIKWKWLRKRQKNLFDEVDKYNAKYNAVLKVIDINDQLADASNQEVSLKERDKLIATLEITRANLISALKTELILRKNRAFLAHNKELLASNLIAMEALQVNHEAREYTKLLNEALQVAQEVEEELRKLND